MGSLISHITRTHAMVMRDYREMFPGHAVQQMSEKQRLESAQRTRLWFNDPNNHAAFIEKRSFPLEIKHWTRKGYNVQEAIKKIAEFQREQSLKGNNDATRALRSANNTSDRNPMSLVSIARRAGVTIEEATMLTPCYGRTGKKHPMFGKHHTDKALEKIANAHHLRHPTQRSIPEKEIAEFVASFAKHARFNVGLKRWNVDVLDDVTKTIVEHFGCMWHAHDCMDWHPEDVHPLYGCNVSKILDRNSRKLKFLLNEGYCVVVVWECEWRAGKDSQKSRIKNAFDRIQ